MCMCACKKKKIPRREKTQDADEKRQFLGKYPRVVGGDPELGSQLPTHVLAPARRALV